MSDDRQWLAPEALDIIDAAYGVRDDSFGAVRDRWHTAGRPLLSARARAIKDAVEHVLARYCPWRCGRLGTDELVCNGKWTDARTCGTCGRDGMCDGDTANNCNRFNGWRYYTPREVTP